MATAIEAAALLVTAAGVVVFLTAYAATRRIRTALPLLLDFLMAAGLMRLAGDLSWSGILLTVAIIAVRKVAAYGVAEKST
ncbi:hypothetical protein GCM10012287_00120 [Streptomyces daqingensis]|uniref:DUF1622 domain-containing protein n=1 Tax=Streptomyces daqingensis TaxID=1472640 RepID=A0ABQ2LPY5_9ACTN|nr:hypothetical protein [Streptomyces daqingensis]GGO41389.1 hypothetical protein GCM10012287_00120 [Streptomyces daqingensis]